MNETRFQIITPNDLEHYRGLANDIAVAPWPEFMMHDPIANENWHDLFERFEEHQFAMLDTETNGGNGKQRAVSLGSAARRITRRRLGLGLPPSD